jgi:hypothetical protein
LLGSRLINGYDQHRWISAFEYYADMAGFTPETWDDTSFPAARIAARSS